MRNIRENLGYPVHDIVIDLFLKHEPWWNKHHIKNEFIFFMNTSTPPTVTRRIKNYKI